MGYKTSKSEIIDITTAAVRDG